MHRAASPHGAGRTTTGFAPISTPKTAISNRNFSQLETRVTHRKHSPDPKSNRNFRSTISHTWETWGSLFWLRNVAEFGRSRIHAEECQRHDEVPHTPLNCARTASTQRVTQAEVGLCAFAPPPLTSSSLPSSEAKGGPFTGLPSLFPFHPPPPSHTLRTCNARSAQRPDPAAFDSVPSPSCNPVDNF